MKKQLHKGSYLDLNICLATNATSSEGHVTGGYTYLPAQVDESRNAHSGRLSC